MFKKNYLNLLHREFLQFYVMQRNKANVHKPIRQQTVLECMKKNIQESIHCSFIKQYIELLPLELN